ncbi:44621_t:CDS:1, partial [Gigaspora margarita]
IGHTILTSVCSANGYDASTTNHPSNMPVQELSQSPPLLASPATS